MHYFSNSMECSFGTWPTPSQNGIWCYKYEQRIWKSIHPGKIIGWRRKIDVQWIVHMWRHCTSVLSTYYIARNAPTRPIVQARVWPATYFRRLQTFTPACATIKLLTTTMHIISSHLLNLHIMCTQDHVHTRKSKTMYLYNKSLGGSPRLRTSLASIR